MKQGLSMVCPKPHARTWQCGNQTSLDHFNTVLLVMLIIDKIDAQHTFDRKCMAISLWKTCE